jgi:hypothetical protein
MSIKIKVLPLDRPVIVAGINQKMVSDDPF